MTSTDRQRLLHSIQLHLDNSLSSSNLPNTDERRKSAAAFQRLSDLMQSDIYADEQITEHVRHLQQIEDKLHETDRQFAESNKKAKAKKLEDKRAESLRLNGIDF
jgi:hypothetical protein